MIDGSTDAVPPQIGDSLPSFDILARRRTQKHIDKLEREIKSLDLDIAHSEIVLDDRKRAAEEETGNATRHRTYWFFGDVDPTSVGFCMASIGKWARAKTAPISVLFNSPGGSITDGLALYDFMRYLSAQGNPITTIGLGIAASMGAVLLQAGDHRIIGRNAHLLIHEPSTGSVGKISDLRDKEKFVDSLQEKLVKILADRSTLTEQQIVAAFDRRDWWLDADEAVQLGFADEIQ